MNAKEARKLVVGDHVRALFSGRGVEKVCEIIAIDWPTFTLKTKDAKGREMIRTRRYESIYGRATPDLKETALPSWLTWPKGQP